MGKSKRRIKPIQSLYQQFSPSDPCSCEICLSYCKRPGWWTVNEADRAIEAGYANRMMLEMAPDLCFGVISPAFRGCEVNFASNLFAGNGCTFLKDQRCELHGSGFQPLECRFCHHDRAGEGKKCHYAIEKEWNSLRGKSIVVKWTEITHFKEQQQMMQMVNLKP